MMTDPIADMLTRIRNAHTARHPKVRVPNSKLKRSLGKLLVAEGYVAAMQELDAGVLELELRYVDNEPVVRMLKRESRPGRRIYVQASEIPRILGGLGLAVISTSQGVMAGRDARKANIGGELLCTIY